MTDEYVLTESLDRVQRGSLGRREFTRCLLALGLTPPLIAELLRARGVAHAQPKRGAFTPTRRGGGGDLKMLWWQAPTILNPHLAIGVKDGDGSRLFYEPLVSFDQALVRLATPRASAHSIDAAIFTVREKEISDVDASCSSSCCRVRTVPA